MHAEMSMQVKFFKEGLKKIIWSALRRGLAKKAVARCRISIALTCSTFDISESCYRRSPLMSDRYEKVMYLLVELTEGWQDLLEGGMFPPHLSNLQRYPWRHKRLLDIVLEGLEYSPICCTVFKLRWWLSI